MVAEAAALRGHQPDPPSFASPWPPETKMLGIGTRACLDGSQYRILEFSTPDVLEVDLRQLARFGIGSDVTEWYLEFEAVTMPEGRSSGRLEPLRTGGVSAARQSSSRNRRQTFAMLKAAEPF
ncbi:MAG: hypothetical protein MZV70_11615 [Desulfobacterales bacterium]|nr:hypothetical protein [Desulfobacterales bacterium]